MGQTDVTSANDLPQVNRCEMWK